MSTLANSDGGGCGGRMLAGSGIALIGEAVATCRGLSRKERANPSSELRRDAQARPRGDSGRP